MAWSERQRAMLAEMGIRLWSPVTAADAEASPPAPSHAVPALAQQSVAVAMPPEPLQVAPASRAAAPPPAMPVVRPAAAPATAPSLVLGEVGQMDWATLRQAVTSCEACSLCKSRQNPVFGVGHPRARVMVVGEAPGEQEDRLGEPFVGKSGKLLDNMLAAVGLTRSDDERERQVFIANVLKCRPPMNRNPVPEEVLKCEPFLLRQVQLVQPQLILAMGRFAIESLLKTQDAVGKLRGRVHRYADVPVVVSYHPAYLLRQPQEKAKAWDDLCLALDVLRAAEASPDAH